MKTEYLPLFFKHSGLGEILIVGGGNVARAKAEALNSVGCKIKIVASTICDSLIVMCKTNNFAYKYSAYHPLYLKDKLIVIAATNDNKLNRQIYNDCKDRGIFVNVVDAPCLCDFIFPALVTRGSLQIAISSSGISPVLSRMVKQAIEKTIPQYFERLIVFLQNKRQLIRKKINQVQPRRLFLEKFINDYIAEQVITGNVKAADLLLEQALDTYPNIIKSILYLVGSGPGNPDFITVKAVEVLGKADIVIYDRLVSIALLESYVRKDAIKINVGKTRSCHLKEQTEINQLIANYLQKGNIVVRLKGGDPGIYGQCAEEINIAKQLDVPYYIVPGVSAANGSAAYAGIPLTARGVSHSVRLMAFYRESRDFWQGFSCTKNETLVFYMSSNYYGEVCNTLTVHLSVDTPFLIIEQGTTPFQKEYFGTLGEYDKLYRDNKFLSPSLLIIGHVVNNYSPKAREHFSTEKDIYFKAIEHIGL